MKAQEAVSVTLVGRINFVLRTLVVTAMAFSITLLTEGLLHLDQLPRQLYVLQRIVVFGLVGTFLFRTINGRLLDAGLARWYKFPVFALWLTSISLPAILPQWSALGPVLFALVLIFGGVVPGKSVLAKSLATKDVALENEESSGPSKRAASLPLVNRIGFLRSLITLACLWLPLIWLENLSGNHLGAWLARLCYCILCVVWA
ncbi:MAG: hypothetical protein ABSG00_03100, partial [Terracidiphilus sp.]